MSLDFLGPLRRGAPLEEDERTDKFVTPLELIDKAELELDKIEHRFHQSAPPSGGSCPCQQDTPGWELACSAARTSK